jgi:hypothetical protein
MVMMVLVMVLVMMVVVMVMVMVVCVAGSVRIAATESVSCVLVRRSLFLRLLRDMLSPHTPGLSSYPTLLLFPADDKNNPVRHEGPRTVDGLTSFLEENAATLNDDEGDSDYDDSI